MAEEMVDDGEMLKSGKLFFSRCSPSYFTKVMEDLKPILGGAVSGNVCCDEPSDPGGDSSLNMNESAEVILHEEQNQDNEMLVRDNIVPTESTGNIKPYEEQNQDDNRLPIEDNLHQNQDDNRLPVEDI